METRLRPVPVVLSALALLFALWAVNRWAYVTLPAHPPHTHTMEGVVTYLRATAGDGLLVQVRADGVSQTLLLSPRLGALAQPMLKGDRWRFVGTFRDWRGKRYFEPVSLRHCSLVEREQAIATPLSRLENLAEKTLVEVTATAEDVEIFTSRAGKEHLRFRLRDSTGESSAIMWQGTFTSRDRRRLEAGLVTVRARVDRYRNKPSLVVEAIR